VLKNAIGFSPPGGKITMTLTMNGETVGLQIHDKVPGVDRNVETVDVLPSAHAGLGLWIVRRNVEALGGYDAAANRIGGGLSVTIILPPNDA
jgi:two-component system sensor histidine kinase ChvG